MWIKEIRLYDIEVYKDGELVYKGSAEEAPEEIKNLQPKSTSFEKKAIRIEI